MTATRDGQESKTAESKSTATITKSLQSRNSFCGTLMGYPMNPHIAHDSGTGLVWNANFSKNGITTIAQNYFAKAKPTGIFETFLATKRTFFITSASYWQQIIVQNAHLKQGDVGGVQEYIMGPAPNTIISIPTKHPEYAPQRKGITSNLFSPPVDLIPVMQKRMRPLVEKIVEAKDEIDLQKIAGQISLTLIGGQIGLEKFGKDEKAATQSQIRFAEIVHHVVSNLTFPYVLAGIFIENKVSRWTGHRLGYVPGISKKIKEGEELIKSWVRLNQDAVLTSLKTFNLKKYNNYKVTDLTNDQAMRDIKLFVIGGFETTSKLLLFSMIMMGAPENKSFVEKIRKELSDAKQEFTGKDFASFPHLQAFIFEVMRLFPSFSYRRSIVEKNIVLLQNVTPSQTKDEHHAKMQESKAEDDIMIPAGSVIMVSHFDTQRDQALFGKDAEVFNPDRWLDISFDLRDIMTTIVLFTFGNYLRSCPGRLFAEKEAQLLIAELIMQGNLTHNLKLPISPKDLEIGFTLEMAKGIVPKGIFTKLEKVEVKKEAKEEFGMGLGLR